MTITLITGGSRGLGRETALEVAKRGGDVIFTYHAQADAAAEVVAAIEATGRKAAAIQLDTGDLAQFARFVADVRKTLDGWGASGIDHLVNNAGAAHYAPIADTTEAAFDTLVNVHLKGVYFLTQALLPLLNDHGRILNISSGLARFSMPGSSAYAMMKGGIEVFTRYLAVELGARGITANTVAPGAIATDFGGGRVRDTPELNQALSSQTPLGRVGQADDIGGMIAALLGPENKWVNAQRIEVSGGFRA